MTIVLLIIIGAAAGFLATRAFGWEADIPTTVVIGIAGALIGGLALRAVVTMAAWMAGFVGALMGAVLLVWLWQRYGR